MNKWLQCGGKYEEKKIVYRRNGIQKVHWENDTEIQAMHEEVL